MKVDWHRKLIDEESWLVKKVDCQRKFIDKEKWLTKKLGWQRKLIDKENWLTMKVYGQRKLIVEESWLTMVMVQEIFKAGQHKLFSHYCNWVILSTVLQRMRRRWEWRHRWLPLGPQFWIHNQQDRTSMGTGATYHTVQWEGTQPELPCLPPQDWEDRHL